MIANVYWLTGLSGAGKTTIGKCLFNQLKKKNPSIVFLDGDTMREVFGNCFGYSLEERHQCAMCYSRLCKLLSDQEMDVVCCTISMFDSVREWNRKNIPGYIEIYIKASQDTLIARDQKSLYSNLKKGEAKHIMGMDISVEEPKNPDIVINNNGQITVHECVEKIMNGSKFI